MWTRTPLTPGCKVRLSRPWEGFSSAQTPQGVPSTAAAGLSYVCLRCHLEGLGPLVFDCPVSLQMKPSCHQMFRATSLLRGPFLTDRKPWSGLMVATRPMGTSRATVRPQPSVQLQPPGAAASSGLGQLPGIPSSICGDLAGWMTQAFSWGFWDLTCASSARF